MAHLTHKPDLSLTNRLGDFLLLVLRLAPPLLWLLMSLMIFALINAGLSEEIWPNTPGAEKFFLRISLTCVGILPWVLVYLAWQIAAAVEHWFWRLAWRMAGMLGCFGATLVSGLALIFIWMQ